MAGSVVQTFYDKIGTIKKATFAVTFGAAGAFTATALTSRIDGKLLRLVTDPGSTAPQDAYDITLLDGAGVDVLQGVGLNRSNVNSEAAAIVYSGTSIHPCVSPSDTLTLTIGGNNVANATTDITVYWIQGA